MSEILRSTERQRFAPIGRCVYCRSTTPPLTNEHIIPQGLNGREVLPSATCEDCQDETRAFEAQVQRIMFWPMRVRAGMHGTKRKKPPEQIDVTVITGGMEVKAALPPAEIPISGALPIFRPAGFLMGFSPDETTEAQEFNLEIY